MTSLSLGPYLGARRGGLLDDRPPFGGFSAGGLGAPRFGRGLTPFNGHGLAGGLGGLGYLGSLGSLGVGALSHLSPRQDMLGASYPGLAEALLRGGRYPDFRRRHIDDLHLSSRLGPRELGLLLGLGMFDQERGLCNDRGCRGGLGCGYDRRCEHERCLYDCSRCSGNGNGRSSSSSSSSKDFKTKDIVVRGKTFKIRKSFLADAGKFEGDIVKLLDKKSEESFPNYVVQMLVDFINEESCKANTILDLVSLNVLASSLGVKSAVEFSLNQIKKHEYDRDIGAVELTDICVAVLLSSKVDDKITEWLKKHLKAGERWRELVQHHCWKQMIYRRPELEIQVGQLVGEFEKDDREDGLRIL